MSFYLYNIRQLFSTKCFKGWGRKKSGRNALFLAKKFGGSYLLLEDGFIRSFGLGIEDSPSFSIVQDNLGIYYDSTTPSQLENLLNTYDFNANPSLLKTAKEAINLITTHHISKYNHAPDVPQNYFAPTNSTPTRILIISQTQNDSSLIYGNANAFTTSQIIQDALTENPNCEIYLKIHPDVLSGHKKSDFNPSEIPAQIKLIYEDFNPISLLKYFKKVYTKTSQMGFEALLVGCECVCYGMPFYAGWGLTIDKQTCPRRKRKLKLEEVFVASYILYSHYYNPFYQRKSDILDTLQTLICYKHYYIKTHKKAFMFGFSTWKHTFIPPFMPNFNPKNIIFINPLFSSHLKVAFKKG